MTTVHVRRAVAGDAASLEWLVARLSPLLLLQARQRLTGPLAGIHGPDDLVQETWRIAIPKLGNIRERGGRYTPVLIRFLSQVLLNRTSELVRMQIRRKPSDAGESVWDRIVDENTAVVERAQRAEEWNRLETALTHLDEQERDIFVLRAIERVPNHLAATKLGLKANTLSVKYQRVLEKLRRRLPGSVVEEL